MSEAYHSIIQRPWEFKIKKFHYDCTSEDSLEHFIDIQFVKGDEIRNLRFIGPKQLKIEEGFPYPTSGLAIMDIRNRGLEDINIRVTDFEATTGAITFYAKYLIEIPLSEASPSNQQNKYETH